MHSLGSTEGYLPTLNKMTNRSEAGQGAAACLLGEAPQVKQHILKPCCEHKPEACRGGQCGRKEAQG